MATVLEAAGLAGLKHLTNAKSKQTVNSLFEDVFKNKLAKAKGKQNPQDQFITKVAADFSVKPDEADALVNSIEYVITEAIYYKSVQPAALFPTSFQAQMKDLLAQILTHHLPKWRESILEAQVSLPRLQSFDWRIDLKAASRQISRMVMPTVLVELKVEDYSAAGSHNVNFELNRETLQAVLDNLGKIRDQLNAVAGQS